MAYIVPRELPKSCFRCPFAALKWQYPFWSRGDDLANTKAYTCQADAEKRVVVLEIDDETSKAEWCPLKEVIERTTNEKL